MAESSGVPAAIAAPLVAPAHVGYAQAIPQNIPPYASQISVVNRAVSPYIAASIAPFVGGPAPFVPGPYIAGPAPYVAGPAPVLAGPGPVLAGPAPYALPAPAAYAAPFPYAPFGAASPLLRTPFGYAPTFVR